MSDEPETFGFTCLERDCTHNDSEQPEVSFATMGEALDAARAHRAEHVDAVQGIVTFSGGAE